MSFFWPFLKLHIFPLNIILFFPQYKKTIFSHTISVKKGREEKFRFLDQIHGLTPLKSVHFFALFKTSIFWSYNVCFLSRILKNDFFSDIISVKKHPYEKFRFLDKIHGRTLLENVYFLPLFKTSIFST